MGSLLRRVAICQLFVLFFVDNSKNQEIKLCKNLEKEDASCIRSADCLDRLEDEDLFEKIRKISKTQCQKRYVCCGPAISVRKGLLDGRCGYQDKENINNDYVDSTYSWIVLLEYKDLNGSALGYICLGSLISQKYVLTAASCIQRKGVELIQVSVGDTIANKKICRFTEGPQCNSVKDYSIESSLVHPNYKPGSFENDIGLIKLVDEVKFTKDRVSAICVPFSNDEPEVGNAVILSGWGNPENLYESLQAKKTSKMTIISTEDCQQMWKNRTGLLKHVNIDDKQLCTVVNKNNSAVGFADAGGPIMYYNVSDIDGKWRVDGIITLYSFSSGDSDKYVLVGTKVSKYLDWIQKNIEAL